MPSIWSSWGFFVKDCYNNGGGRSSRPKGKLIVKSEACWRLLYSWVYVAVDYSPLHNSRQDRCYRNRSEIGMLCGHSNFRNWTNPGLFPLTWYCGGRKRKRSVVKPQSKNPSGPSMHHQFRLAISTSRLVQLFCRAHPCD